MKSIQNKISIFIIILISITALLITSLTLFIFYNNSISQLKEDSQALSTAYSLAIRQQIQGFQKEIGTVASFEGITSENPNEQEAMLTKLASNTGFGYFALADGNGKTTRNSDISQREYFQKAMDNITYMSSPLVNMVDGSVTIMMATPLHTDTGTYKVLYGGIPYDIFSQVINDIRIGDGGYAFVVDKAGTVVAHPDSTMVEEMKNFVTLAQEDESYHGLANVIGRMVGGESNVDFADFNGQNRLYAFTPVGTPEGWSIAVSVPVSQITAGIYRVLILCLIVAAVLLLAGILAALQFARSITKPIIAVTQRLELLSQGNLSAPIPEVRGKDELARLSAALSVTVTELNSYIGDISIMLSAMASNDFTITSAVTYKGEFIPIQNALEEISQSLKNTLTIINTSTEQVSVGAEQVSSGAYALASGSTEQAASIQELTGLVSDISNQAQDNSSNVENATKQVNKTVENILSGNEQMEQLTYAMNEIGRVSDQIVGITNTIEDIAFQTNILALNAAIEAARAGNAGRGFAVVADEVRNLASKSAEAASQTAELIGSSVQTISKGTKITADTAKVLQQIEESAQQITESFSRIEKASMRQTEGIEQINISLSQISAVVQTNASTAEENSATSEEMSAQAATLRQEVGKFKLGDVHQYHLLPKL